MRLRQREAYIPVIFLTLREALNSLDIKSCTLLNQLANRDTKRAATRYS